MKKILLSIALLLTFSICMAQTAPINQTPTQLAEQMVASISRDVTLTAEQQSQLAASATQYFTSQRNATRSTSHARTELYEQFQTTLKSIMTEELYDQWRSRIEERVQQHLAAKTATAEK